MGMFVAWTITLVKAAFVIAIFVLMAYYEWKPFAATIGMNVFFVLAWFVRTKCIGAPRRPRGESESELFRPSTNGYSKLFSPGTPDDSTLSEPRAEQPRLSVNN